MDMKDKVEILETLHIMDFNKLSLLDDGRGALILGYRVELTKKECEIIRILLGATGAMSMPSIAELSGIAESSIPVHVSNINKKALAITRRRLIVGNRQGEYKISDVM